LCIKGVGDTQYQTVNFLPELEKRLVSVPTFVKYGRSISVLLR